MDPIINAISIKTTGQVDANVVATLEEYRRSYPDTFKLLQIEMEKYPIVRKLDDQTLSNMISQVTCAAAQESQKAVNLAIKKEKIEAANNFLTAMNGIAVIARSPVLTKTVKISSHTVKAFEQADILKGIIAQGLKDKTENILDVKKIIGLTANPSLILATIGLELLGSFMGSTGPSIEQIMLDQLQMISEQIAELHKEMLKEFKEVHKHLDLIHTNLLQCSNEIKFLIKNQVQGFRSNAMDSLDRIDAILTTLHNMMHTGTSEILRQGLLKLCTSADARLNKHAVQDEKSAVQEVMHRLEREWILNQSASLNFNGGSMFTPGNTSAARITDSRVLFPNADKLKPMLGYMFLTAQEMGLNIAESSGIPTVAIDKVMHPDIFAMATAKYLNLGYEFSQHVQDDDKGSKYTAIHNFANNTINFIRKVQRSDMLFNKLFENYNSAVQELDAAIKQQIRAANIQFANEFDTREVDLSSDYLTIMGRMTQQLPTTFESNDASAGLPILDSKITTSHLIYNAQFILPADVYAAQTLKLGSLSGSYSGTMKFASPYPPGTATQEHKLGPRCDTDTTNKTFTLEFGFLQQHAADSLWHMGGLIPSQPASGSGVRFGLGGRRRSHVPAVKGYDSTGGGFNYSYPITVEFSVSFGVDSIFKRTFVFSGTRTISNSRDLPSTSAALIAVLNDLNFSSEIISDDNHTRIEALKSRVQETIINQRKIKIAQPLLTKQSEAFNNALTHLESAKRRLESFSLLAGLPMAQHNDIKLLPDSQKILNDLSSYISDVTTDMNIAYCNLPNIENVNAQCIHAIRLHRSNPTFVSPLMEIIRKTIAEVLLHQSIFLLMRGGIHLQQKIPHTAEGRACELGFNLTDLAQKFANEPQYAALIEAIITHDMFSVIRTSAPNAQVKLDKILNVKLIIPLHLAAYIGNAEIIRALLTRTPETLNFSNINGVTPIMYAVLSGSLQAVKVFCDNGADLTLQDRNEKTALQLARDFGYLNIVEYLEGLDANPRAAAALRHRLF